VNDDRISRALHQQADAITLTPADPTGTMRRGNRRRTRRRAGLAGAVAVVGVLATTVAVRDSGDQQLQLGSAANAAASTYQWSVVSPRVGLGYGGYPGTTAQLADGSIYSISTTPGVQSDPSKPASPALYSSSDGTEWDQRSLPSGSKTYDVAGAGDTLYGIGTAPSGGIVVSASRDGAATWSTAAQLPDDLVQLKSRHPGQVVLNPPRIAAQDSTHLVVTVTAGANLDLTKLGHPEYPQEQYRWAWDESGVQVFEIPRAECDPPAKLDTTDSTLAAEGVTSCRADAIQAKDASSDPVASFTYDDLGVTGELRELVGGKPFVYVTDDGATFQRADLAEALPASNGMRDVTPLATPDGYRLFVTGYTDRGSAASAFRSSDGHGWAADGSFAGGVSTVGVITGHPAAAVWTDQGGASLMVEGDGGWTPVDLTHLVATAGGEESYLNSLAFGPLGVAGVVGVVDKESGRSHEYVVHSTDGVQFGVVDIRQHLDGGGVVSGLVVTPDAIAVRVSKPNDGSTRTPPTQRVLVGTPQ
jgi:hypothetical protein